MKIMDIHSHTYYSGCGADPHEAIIDAAIAGGIDIFGISDHNYGIREERLEEYKQNILERKEIYKDKIQLLLGIELASVPGIDFQKPELLDGFDYCLLEHIDNPQSTVGLGVFDYRKNFKCKFGIAHTDLIGMARNLEMSPLGFLMEFARNDIFWEMNVNYDTIHGHREHAYYLRFLESEEEQEMVRKSGIRISVGFDGHRVYDYKPERVVAMCRFLDEHNIPMVEFN